MKLKFPSLKMELDVKVERKEIKISYFIILMYEFKSFLLSFYSNIFLVRFNANTPYIPT